MHFSDWLVFCGVAFVVTFSPGPGILLAISNAMAHGPRRTVLSSLGNISGLVMLAALAMTGMGAVLAMSALAFTVLKVCGALYLIYLGIQQWRVHANNPLAQALRDRSAPASAQAPGNSPAPATDNHAAPDYAPPSHRALYTQGMGIALTNPKAILFFSALFPQFIRADAPVFTQAALLTGTFVALSLASHVFYVLLARSLRHQLAQPRKQRLFQRTTGSLFVLLGLGLLRLQHKS